MEKISENTLLHMFTFLDIYEHLSAQRWNRRYKVFIEENSLKKRICSEFAHLPSFQFTFEEKRRMFLEMLQNQPGDDIYCFLDAWDENGDHIADAQIKFDFEWNFEGDDCPTELEVDQVAAYKKICDKSEIDWKFTVLFRKFRVWKIRILAANSGYYSFPKFSRIASSFDRKYNFEVTITEESWEKRGPRAHLKIRPGDYDMDQRLMDLFR